MSATVTVVVRTRNRPAMLTRALASIASQTFDDYEVVIVMTPATEAEVRFDRQEAEERRTFEDHDRHERGLEWSRGGARVRPGCLALHLLCGPRR